MKIIWESAAKLEMRKRSVYCKTNIGIFAYREFRNCIKRQIELLVLFPQSGQRELLLEGFSTEYRSMVVKRYHLKIVYCIDESERAVHISAIWDTRRAPQNLREGFQA